ncbi:MAG: TonB-dependent receptor plug domain-containing protein, partial [Planctomycetota bacterium]|nr:TonB-dependent receptor plug domain-containing protein [Planctomycetota bacterium]
MIVRQRTRIRNSWPAIVVMMAISRAVVAQSTEQSAQQEPLVVTPSLQPQEAFNEPYWVDVIGAEEIRERGYRTLPQALRDLPGVMIQETAPGQGSPFIRGFTGFQNLLLIDGVRLNNSVFRSGPNQYWSTIDLLSVRRLEVLQGPAAAQYGSDAVGGVVQVFTSDPYAFAKDRGLAVAGSTYTRYASGEDSIWGRGELSIGHTWEDGSSTAMLLGGDAKAFGDIEGGRATGTQDGT